MPAPYRRVPPLPTPGPNDGVHTDAEGAVD